jgi:hypothetical protein
MTYRTAMKVLENRCNLSYKIETISKAMKKVGVSIAITERGHYIKHTTSENVICKPTITKGCKNEKKVRIVGLLELASYLSTHF